MSRYTGPKEKISRRLGENLALKGERSISPKSAFLRKPYPPGVHGKKRRRALSDFGSQLQEKQKVRFTYGIGERQFKKYFNTARAKKGLTNENLVDLLESRLDNTVFRGGLAGSRSIARQLVSHGHFLVNGKRVTIPSFELKPGELVTIRPQSAGKKIFLEQLVKFKKATVPSWLEKDAAKSALKVKSRPKVDETPLNFNINAIIDYYSR